MRAITYTHLGDPTVLRLVDKPIPAPSGGEVRIRVVASGVNPSDRKSRSGAFGGRLTGATVPGQDGAGVVDAVGAGVAGFEVGERVWVTLAADGRAAGGTAQEYTIVSAERAFALPAGADFELGASIGIPAVSAHRALTVAEDGPARLRPGALGGRTARSRTPSRRSDASRRKASTSWSKSRRARMRSSTWPFSVPEGRSRYTPSKAVVGKVLITVEAG
jgi:NADPH:quinone reductase